MPLLRMAHAICAIMLANATTTTLRCVRPARSASHVDKANRFSFRFATTDRAPEEHTPEIGISSFADTQQFRLAAGRALTRNQPESMRIVSPSWKVIRCQSQPPTRLKREDRNQEPP